MFCEWGLGMPVCEALAYAEQHRSFFDVVQVKYNDEVKDPISLWLPSPGDHGFVRVMKLGFMRESHRIAE